MIKSKARHMRYILLAFLTFWGLSAAAQSVTLRDGLVVIPTDKSFDNSVSV